MILSLGLVLFSSFHTSFFYFYFLYPSRPFFFVLPLHRSRHVSSQYMTQISFSPQVLSRYFFSLQFTPRFPFLIFSFSLLSFISFLKSAKVYTAACARLHKFYFPSVALVCLILSLSHFSPRSLLFFFYNPFLSFFSFFKCTELYTAFLCSCTCLFPFHFTLVSMFLFSVPPFLFFFPLFTQSCRD